MLSAAGVIAILRANFRIFLVSLPLLLHGTASCTAYQQVSLCVAGVGSGGGGGGGHHI